MGLIYQGSVDVKEMMARLEAKSREIGDIVNVITEIADQTNLLALNASIESARAGIHGKGFAVVADEVKKLAEQSRRSSNQVTEMIKQIQHDTLTAAVLTNEENKMVEDGLELVKETGKIFDHILIQIEQVSDQAQEISAVTEELSASTEQVNASMEEVGQLVQATSARAEAISGASEQQLAAMEEVASSATSLAQISEKLKKLVSSFKV